MKRNLIFPIIFVLLFSGHSQAAEYSLRELINIALEWAERVNISEEELVFSQKQKDRAVSALYPRLSAFGDFKQYTEEQTSGGRTVQPDRSTVWGVRLDQSLSLSGREFTALGAAKAGIAKAGHDFYSAKEDYALRVASAYYDLLRANKAVGIAASNLERLKKYRDAAESRMKIGELTKAALLRAEAELSAAKSEMVRAENAKKLAKTVLISTVGATEDFGIKELGPEDKFAFDICGLDEPDSILCLKERANTERAELKSLRLQEDISRAQVKINRGAFWPSLSIEGAYARMESDPASAAALDESAYGGVKLTFLFFDGGQRRAELAQARSRYNQSSLLLSEVKRTVFTQVERAYLDLIAQRQLLASASEQLAFAKENYGAVSRQFELGLSSSLDLMDANTLLLNSENQHLSADLGLGLAELRLMRETGVFLKAINNSARDKK